MSVVRERRSAEAAKTRRAEILVAMQMVRGIGLAPFVRMQASMPKSYTGPEYARWLERQREATAEIASRLREKGMSIEESAGFTRVHYLGISATSTLGLLRALRTWRERASAKVGSK